jgi:hypothetical protein
MGTGILKEGRLGQMLESTLHTLVPKQLNTFAKLKHGEPYHSTDGSRAACITGSKERKYTRNAFPRLRFALDSANSEIPAGFDGKRSETSAP